MSDPAWERAINLMITSIKSDNNMLDFFKSFVPDENYGYAWSPNPQYKHYVRILERLTNSTGHSGASFAICLRESVQRILSENIIEATDTSDTSEIDSNIITLEPIH